MADRYTVIQNFKRGLDARRSELTSSPGTLIQCQNAHINSGGEIEQRMSFGVDAVTYPASTFGLQDTSVGLVTFGSVASPGSLPTGVTYQRLTHPTGYYSSGTIAMTGVVFSCNYLGNAFVIAKWTDGTVLCYYDGSLVLPSRDGLVLVQAAGNTIESASNLSTDLAAIVNATSDWVALANTDAPAPTISVSRFHDHTTATINVIDTVLWNIGDTITVTGMGLSIYNGTYVITDLTVTSVTFAITSSVNEGSIGSPVSDTNGTIYNHSTIAITGTTLVQSPPGVHFVPSHVINTTSGQVGELLIDQDFGGISPVPSRVAFTLTGTGYSTADTITVTAPGGVFLGQANWVFPTLNYTALALVYDINSRTYLTGYYAIASGATVMIVAPLSAGAITTNITCGGTITTSAAALFQTFTMSLSPPSVRVSTIQGGSGVFWLGGKCTASTFGQTGQVSFLWQECNVDGSTGSVAASGIYLHNSLSPTASFSAPVPATSTLKGYFKCTATDAGATFGSPTSQVVTVTLSWYPT
jgi:hypothetical protein